MLAYKRLLHLLLGLTLTSCTVGPNYIKPSMPLSAHFKEAKQPIKNKHWKKIQPNDAINRGQWWKLFNDDTLNKLENALNHGNQTIIQAQANFAASQAIVQQARSALFPVLSGTFNTLRQTTGNGTTTFTSSSAATGTTQGTTTTGFISKNVAIRSNTAYYLNANWEPDIWGQVRRNIELNEAAAQSSQALLAATRLSAEGALAQYYFELRTLDKDQDLLNKTVKNYQTALKLTKHQYQAGVAGQADIIQAQTQLEVAEAQAINNGVLRSQYEHAIAVLTGQEPACVSLPFNPLNTKPPLIPVTVPSVWLERRPDVASAERLMQQANAAIGLAVSAYYPIVNLSGSTNGTSISLGNLLTNPITGWSMGLAIFETIYDAGLREGVVRAARANYQAQVANYRQTVLTAFQDVEDSLSALRLLKKAGIKQTQAANSAKKALQLVTNQYKAGQVPYSSVLNAEITAFSAQKTAYDNLGLQMISAVALIKALGGGWSVRDIG